LFDFFFKGSDHKTTSKKVKMKKKVTVGASGTGRQEQVAELKKKWSLKYTAGVGSPHPGCLAPQRKAVS
jgi:hypothetical protein